MIDIYEKELITIKPAITYRLGICAACLVLLNFTTTSSQNTILTIVAAYTGITAVFHIASKFIQSRKKERP